jgi:hypothetical protein
MKYKIHHYDSQEGVAHVKICNDADDIDQAQLFSIALASLANVSDFNKAIYELFASFTAAQEAKTNIPFDLAQYVQSATNVVVPLTIGVGGVVQGANSNAADSGNATHVLVL